MAGEGATKAHEDGAGHFDAVNIPMRRWEDWERSRLRKLKREEKRRREMERAYRAFPGDAMQPGHPAFLRPFTQYSQADDWETDTVSIISSTDDDQWGTQIGGYNENGSMYPPPPATLHSPAPAIMESAQTLGKDELEAMLEQGWDDATPPVPPIPKGINQTTQRYQLTDAHGGHGGDGGAGGFNAYAPVGNTPRTSPATPRHVTIPETPLVSPNASSSAVDGERRTHVKKRSGSKSGGPNGYHEYVPMSPLGHSSRR